MRRLALLLVLIAPFLNVGCNGSGSAANDGGSVIVADGGSGDAGVVVTGPFSLGGTVAGLDGTGLVIRNANDELPISADGTFTFGQKLERGTDYTVEVETQPADQACIVVNAVGTVRDADIANVQVVCTTNHFFVGGAVTGLRGAGLKLQNNEADELALTRSGPFTFPRPIDAGQSYDVTVSAQPTTPSQECVVASGAGTIESTPIKNVLVICTTSTFALGGTVSGVVGQVVLSSNGQVATVTSDGPFAFVEPIESAKDYDVTVIGQPVGQTCTVTKGTGSIADAAVSDVQVTCVSNTYALGGAVSGLLSGTVSLQLNGAETVDLSANGAYGFQTKLAFQSTYGVAVTAQPVGQSCVVANDSGSIGGGAVTNLNVVCAPNQYAVSGTASGLAGSLALSLNGAETKTLNADGTYSFTAKVPFGSAYVVTIASQPASPSQTCTIDHATGTVGAAAISNVEVVCVTNRFVVSGSVSGLQGTGLKLKNNAGDETSVTGSSFVFATSVPSAQPYAVSVSAQPTAPTQHCTVVAGAGTITNKDVSNVLVVCTTPTYSLGGTVSGLKGSVVLQSNGQELSVYADGPFAFTTPLESATAFDVKVKTQPIGEDCTVTNGTGTLTSADVSNVLVACVPKTYSVGGSVSGLLGSLVLQLNGASSKTLTADGAFTFTTVVAYDSNYAVAIQTQPTGQTCALTSASGKMSAANVTSVRVTCTTSRYAVGGTVTGLSGTLALQLNGAETRSITGNGAFTFATALPSGADYAATITGQPAGQTCTLASASGKVAATNVTSIAVSCTTNSYTVGGTVSGLSGTVALLLNGTETLNVSADSAFTFLTHLNYGTTYAVAVKTQPTGQRCTVTNGNGAVPAAAVTNIAVTCTTGTYAMGGTVSGLSGTVALLLNGTETLNVSANGSFSFLTSLAYNANYAVTVKTQPTGQTCALTNASGAMPASTVTNVVLVCTTNKYSVGGSISGLVAGTSIALQLNGSETLTASANGAFTFTTPVAYNTAYAATIQTQPAGQTCTLAGGSGTMATANVSNLAVSCTPSPYTVGGTVAGLSGTLVLQINNGETKTVTTSGTYAFPTALVFNSAYAITIQSQPTGQTCALSSAGGKVPAANITTADVSCTTNSYAIGGAVSGLAGTVSLRLNGGETVNVSTNGTFNFISKLAYNASYAVTLASQPASQTCTVTSGSGNVPAGNVTTIAVSCTTNSYTVGGSVSGLISGSSITLQISGGETKTVNANGSYSFPTARTYSSAYAVTITAQPAGHSCTVANGSGNVPAANVTTVNVTCTPGTYAVGGIVSGLTGTVVLELNSGAQTRTITANGTYAFPTALVFGSSYAVSIQAQPAGQTCTLANGSGTVLASNVSNIAITCTDKPPDSFSVSGAVTGLNGSLTLQINAGELVTETSDSAFTFTTLIANGSPYTVTIKTKPSTQNCTLTGGSGTISGADVTNVAVSCTTNRYTVGGTVSGLSGALTLRINGGETRDLFADGTYAFPTSLNDGTNYSVAILSQPAGQNCTLAHASATLTGANVTNVDVTCTTNRYTVGGAVSGLSGTVSLLLNGLESVNVSANTTFSFLSTIAYNGTYSVTVQTQPSNQTCTVTHGSGTIQATVTDVAVSCSFNAMSVGGKVTGLLAGGSVQLSLGGANTTTVLGSSDGTFTFPTHVAPGTSYSVTIPTQPTGQTCTVTSTMPATMPPSPVTDLAVSCTTNKYAVGVAVSGLSGSVSLALNGSETVTRTTDGSFQFTTQIAYLASYQVTVTSSPAGQTCIVSPATATTMGAANASVSVTCGSATYTVGGTVSGLSSTTASLQLTSPGNTTQTLSSQANGSFTFPTGLAGGSSFTVSATATNHSCTVTQSAQTASLTSNVTDVAVSCVPAYTLGGTVTGRNGTLVLQNGSEQLTVTTNAFTFVNGIASGASYNVTVASHPAGQTCTVSSGSGNMPSSNVTSVSVACVNNTVGGSITGLFGQVKLQNNGGDTLTLYANSTFTFATSVSNGSNYAVTVSSQPANQTCTVTSGSGTISGAVSNVKVACTNTASEDLVMVLRVGTGTGTLTNAATAMFVDEYRISTGALVRTLTIPASSTGQLTMSGTATSEGGISRSADKRYVIVPGFDAVSGTATVAGTNSSSVQRAVTRVNASGTVDTPTKLGTSAFSTADIRGATSDDGTNYWATGSATGVVTIAAGGSSSTTITTSPTNLRCASIFEGQLFTSAGASSNFGVLQTGTGMPKTTGQTNALLTGFPTSSSPVTQSFAVLDADPNVAGPDLIYIAVDATPGANVLNVQKWKKSGTTWSQVTWTPTYTGNTSPARGLAVSPTFTTDANGNSVISSVRVVATTGEGSGQLKLVTFVDTNPTGAVNPTVSLVATSPGTAQFRGVAFSPF